MTEFEIFWLLLCLYGFPFLLIAFVCLAAAWIIWEVKFTPKEAKQIRRAARRKVPISLNAGDDGYGDFEPLTIKGNEGYMATSKKEKSKWIGFLPRPSSAIPHDFEVDPEKDKVATKKIAEYINRLATRKLYLRHAKIPIWLGYKGKSILTALYSLIALEIIEDLQANGGTPEINPYLKVDLYALKQLFSKPWDQTQIRNNEIRAKLEGQQEAKKFLGKEPLTILFISLGAMFGLAVILVVVTYLFG